MPSRRLRIAAVCLLVGGYVTLAHICNSVGAHDLGAALSLAPLTLFGLVVAWRWKPGAAIALTLAAALLVRALWPVLQKNFSLFLLVQETYVYCALGLSFARSLTGGRVALCTQLAAKMGGLSPREIGYTRHVTAAWSIFFFAVAFFSVFLFTAAPLRIWSIYINFCVMPMIGAMFIVEYLIRCRVVPEGARAGPLHVVRMYFANPYER
jgi:uncharacterized membrane protein